MKVKCLIIDDEPLAREVLESYIQEIDMLELVASCKSALEAFNYMQKESIDLIFLDIQMPNLNGIDFLRTTKPNASVIFTTAYREFAIESYDLEALDYLVKPITFPRTLQAVNRYLKIHQHQPTPLIQKEAANLFTEKAFMFLKVDKKMIKVFFDDIIYIESLKDYSRIFTKEKRIITAKNLLYFEHRLPQNLFIRIHKSYMLALSKVKAYSNAEVELWDKTLPIGRTYKQQFLSVMSKT